MLCFHEDTSKMFLPLVSVLFKLKIPMNQRVNALRNYMYMGHIGQVYYYKHRETKEYIYISFNFYLEGILDMKDYSQFWRKLLNKHEFSLKKITVNTQDNFIDQYGKAPF